MILANPKVEMALVACCLAGGADVVRAAAAEIGAEDFHELTQRCAWQVMVSLLESGDTVDSVGFETRWPRVVENVPRPPEEIYEALTNADLPDEVGRHIAEVKEWTRRRQVHQQASKLAMVASNPKADVEGAISECQNALRLPPPAGHNDIAPRRAVELHVSDLEYRHALQGKLSGLSTGFDGLDDCTDGFQKAELSVFGARPHQGKSALLLQFSRHCGLTMNRPVLFISLEMNIEMLMRRLDAMETGIGLKQMKRGKLTEQDFVKITAFNARMAKAPFWFYNGITGLNIARVRNLVRRHVEEHGVELVALDYLQKLPAVTKHEKHTYEVGEVSSGLKAIAMEHNIHVCTAAQLNRDSEKATGKEKGRLPRLSDLADSAQIERDADLVCLLYRKEQSEEAQLSVAKQRDGESYVQHLWYDGPHCQFKESHQEPV